MPTDLIGVREAIARGDTSAAAQIEKSIAAAQSRLCRNVFLETSFESARKDALAGEKLPLAGLAVSIKDLFDIAGQVTRAGSKVLDDAPAAKANSAAVARLRAAGAAFIGRTNMSEFAFSGMGVNPHYGTPVNVADSSTDRLPGGSSSGAAISVASGAAFVGLGSDTGGSIRIPAALNGIVGFKNTARLVPADGALPLSTTLDTVCAMTKTVRDAVLAHEILAARKVAVADRPLSDYRFAVTRTVMTDGMDETVSAAFERTLEALRAAGARVEQVELDEIKDLSTIQSTGGFSAAEAYAWHRKLLSTRAEGYDPRVRARIERGSTMTAAEYVDLVQQRKSWISAMEQTLSPFDAVLSPTVPVVAPPIANVAPGAERDAEFFRVNALLLRNPSVVNMLDGCAISIPCHAKGELPVGLMLWHGALHDDVILNAALKIETLLQGGKSS